MVVDLEMRAEEKVLVMKMGRRLVRKEFLLGVV